jgi:hypothetical protein
MSMKQAPKLNFGHPGSRSQTFHARNPAINANAKL